jgi:hypothetical protein
MAIVQQRSAVCVGGLHRRRASWRRRRERRGCRTQRRWNLQSRFAPVRSSSGTNTGRDCAQKTGRSYCGCWRYRITSAISAGLMRCSKPSSNRVFGHITPLIGSPFRTSVSPASSSPLPPTNSTDVRGIYLSWHGKARTLGQFVLNRQATASDRPAGEDLRQFVRAGMAIGQTRTKCPPGAGDLGRQGPAGCPNSPTPVLLLPLHADRAESGCIGLHTRVTSLKRPPLETGPDLRPGQNVRGVSGLGRMGPVACQNRPTPVLLPPLNAD